MLRFLGVFTCFLAAASAQRLLPGEAGRGAELFRTQQCITCHRVRGEGGQMAPDLGRPTARAYTPSLMASLMWNHAPQMWSTMERRGVTRPQLSEEQAADLFAFFFSARYFERPGDAARGKQLFTAKRCADCHGITQEIAAGGPPVVKWPALEDPIALAQEMWNHAAQMRQAGARRKISWPELSSQELTDVLVYLGNLPETRGRSPQFAPASAETGETLFRVKGCGGCHTGKLSHEGRYTNRTLTDFAAAMWNHAPRMKKDPPQLSKDEMRRIVGYLWSIQFFGQRGNPERGSAVFARKNCASCHGVSGSGAPDLKTALAARKGQIVPFTMVGVLWKHGPAMLERMKQKRIEWPRFAGSEMADLIAYLNNI